MARAGADGFFDENGFPVGADETVRFPDLGEDRVYALEIAGDSMEPMYRAGDVVIVQPGAAVRRGDRVVVRTRAGEVMAKVLGRKNDQTIELSRSTPRTNRAKCRRRTSNGSRAFSGRASKPNRHPDRAAASTPRSNAGRRRAANRL
jgi:hypothetical protein